jgi:hypothetical protein
MWAALPFIYKALILMVASYVITAIFTPSQTQSQAQQAPAGFDEFDFPQVDEGTPQCVFFGECWSPDWTVLAVGNYRTTPIVNGGSGGGK